MEVKVEVAGAGFVMLATLGSTKLREKRLFSPAKPEQGGGCSEAARLTDSENTLGKEAKRHTCWTDSTVECDSEQSRPVGCPFFCRPSLCVKDGTGIKLIISVCPCRFHDAELGGDGGVTGRNLWVFTM